MVNKYASFCNPSKCVGGLSEGPFLRMALVEFCLLYLLHRRAGLRLSR